MNEANSAKKTTVDTISNDTNLVMYDTETSNAFGPVFEAVDCFDREGEYIGTLECDTVFEAFVDFVSDHLDMGHDETLEAFKALDTNKVRGLYNKFLQYVDDNGQEQFDLYGQ